MVYFIIGLVLCLIIETRMFNDENWGIVDRLTLIICWPLHVLGVMVVFLKGGL